MVAQQFRLKNTVKYPTSLIFGGLSRLGLEITDSLLEQGGYVVIVDTYSDENIAKLQVFPKDSLISFIDYTTLPNLDEDLRRLDYVFFFNHESTDLNRKISTQEFLKFSNYIDTTLSLSTKFEAKFLLTTSIRSHQLNLHNDDYKLYNQEHHKTYSEADLQRHSESMVMEYIEKNNLDARIARLGELIGDGIDFSIESSFNNLILDAAKGQSLKLHKDGLETEWLVHILDAAYGIIKSQFSKNTSGKIYSVAYENNFSHLSIAYKLQEVEENAEEIEFIEGRDNLPSLKIYKPAPNLATIGWATKVPFEKALKQSVAAAKIYLLESSSKTEKKDTISGKLKTFFAIAGSSESSTTKDETEYDGPISRLIAERKKQEELKQQSIDFATSSIKIKKRKKARTFQEKFSNWAWEKSLSIGNSFALFKNKSPIEFLGIFVVFGLLLFVFFTLISPLLVFTRNYLSISGEYQNTVNTIKNSEWLTSSNNFKKVKDTLDENIQILSGFDSIFSITSLGDESSEIKNVLKNYSEILDGANDISFALNPVREYLNNYQGNLQLRTSTESYLSVTNTGIDYENFLLDFHDAYPYLQTGIQKYQKGVSDLRKTNISLLPTFMQQNISDINNALFALEDDVVALDRLEYLEDMLGVYFPRTYVLLLLDNSRLKSIGGEVSAYALFTVKNGSIIEVTVKSPEETQFNLSSIDDRKLQEINANKYNFKNKDNLTFNDLTSLTSFSTFADYITPIFKDTFNREVSGVLAIDYTSLQNLLSNLSDNEEVNVNNVNFASGDILRNLISAQNINSGIDTKHKISAQLLANLVNLMFSNPKQNINTLISTLGKEIDNQSLLISTPNIKFNKIVKSHNYDLEKISDSDSYVKIGYNIDDTKVVNIEKYPELNVVKEVAINPEFKLDSKVVVDLPLLGSSQELVVCIPARVLSSSIKVTGIPSARVVINDAQNEKCIVARSITEKQIQFTWSLDTVSVEGVKQLKLSVGKIKGTKSSLDYKISLDSTLDLVKSQPYVAPQGNTLIFTTFLNTDQIVDLEISK